MRVTSGLDVDPTAAPQAAM